MQHLTLFTEDPDSEYPNQDVVWEKFEKAFIAAAGLITHAPVLKDYLYRGLLELQRDNVMYLELRSGLSRVGACPFCSHLLQRSLSLTLPLKGTRVTFFARCRHTSLTGPSTRRCGP